MEIKPTILVAQIDLAIPFGDARKLEERFLVMQINLVVQFGDAKKLERRFWCGTCILAGSKTLKTSHLIVFPVSEN